MITFKDYIQEAKDPHEKIVARLEDLNHKLSRYSHRWGSNPSPRMLSWVSEYNDLKDKHKDGAWKTYCEKNKFSPSHNAYDCIA